MRSVTKLLLPFLLAASPAIFAQSADLPGASDAPGITRPQGSSIIGAMRIDNDEYVIPVGPIQRGAKQPGKTISVTGSIDTVAYGGPPTASSLSTYNALAQQLRSAGYTEVWSCARATCGSAYALVGYLTQPTIDAQHGEWGGRTINSLFASNDDSRYGAFRKDGQYILVLASLMPGKPSGAFLVRIATTPAPPLFQAPATEAFLRSGTTGDVLGSGTLKGPVFVASR